MQTCNLCGASLHDAASLCEECGTSLRATKGEIAAERMRSIPGDYDLAIPQPWLDHHAKDSIEYAILVSGVVWHYYPEDIGGMPFALTRAAADLLRAKRAHFRWQS